MFFYDIILLLLSAVVFLILFVFWLYTIPIMFDRVPSILFWLGLLASTLFLTALILYIRFTGV